MPPSLDVHIRELVLRGRCAACAELVPVGTLLREAPCPTCGTRLEVFPAGGEELLATLERRVRQQRLWVSVGMGAVAFCFGWVPLLPALAYLGAYLWLRLGVLNPLSQFLSPHRRLITRWTSRLLLSVLLVALVVLGMVASLVAPAGMVGNGLLVFLKVWIGTQLLTRYLHWQLRREHAQVKVSALEWLPIGGGLVGLVSMSLLFFWTLFRVATFLQKASHLLVR